MAEPSVFFRRVGLFGGGPRLLRRQGGDADPFALPDPIRVPPRLAAPAATPRPITRGTELVRSAVTAARKKLLTRSSRRRSLLAGETGGFQKTRLLGG